MRKIFLFLTLPLILGGCSLTKKESKIDIKNVEIPEVDHEYFEVTELTINWADILIQNNDTYYVYIYSQNCTHCQELKNYMIETALKRDDIFFVRGTSKDTIKTDVSTSIGATKTEDICILGYPSLLEISEKTVVKNVAGKAKIIDLLS